MKGVIMKKFIIPLMLVLIVAFASNLFAQIPESEVFFMDENGVWVSNFTIPLEERNARLLRSGDLTLGNCNKVYWDILVTIHASIAQWVDFRLDYNQWDWYIRKPGCYAGNSIEAWIASNGDILIDYEGFGPLIPDDPEHNPIDIYYSFGEGILDAEANGWVHASDLNNDDDIIIDDPGTDLFPFPLHYGLAWKLWNKICVDVCNSACDYRNFAMITIVLLNQKDWIEFDTGGWLF
jgi:hypothetical protein